MKSWIAAAVSLFLWNNAPAESLPPNVRLDGPREFFLGSEIAKQDKIRLELSPVYQSGMSRVSLEPTRGNWFRPLESSGFAFDATGLSTVSICRTFATGGTIARMESARIWAGQMSVTVQFSRPAYDGPGWDFVTTMICQGPFRKITAESHDWLDQNYKTELAAADYLFGLTRVDVLESTWPKSAENLAWVLAFPVGLARSNDNLTRYEISDLVYFTTLRKFEKDKVVKSLTLSGYVFDKRSGKWLGEILAWAEPGGDSPRPPEKADIEKALQRVTIDKAAVRAATLPAQ